MKSLGKPAYVVVDGNLPAFSFHTMGETCMVSVPVPFFFRPPNIVARFFPVWTTSSPRTATVSGSQAAGLSRAPCVSLLIVDLGRGEAVQTTNEGSLAVPGYQGWTACNRNAKEGRLCLSAALDVRFGCMRFAGRFAGVSLQDAGAVLPVFVFPPARAGGFPRPFYPGG